jgi:hypothetical protein
MVEITRNRVSSRNPVFSESQFLYTTSEGVKSRFLKALLQKG